MVDKKLVIVGGALIALAAGFYFFSNKEMTPSGGSAYGQSSGYEGGGSGLDNLLSGLSLGGETIVFPPPENPSIQSLLPDIPAGTTTTSKKDEALGNTGSRYQIVSAFVPPKTPVTNYPVIPAGYGDKPEQSGNILSDVFTGLLGVVSAPAAAAVGAVKTLGSISGSKSGISSSSSGISKKDAVTAPIVSITMPKKGGSGSSGITSYQVGGSGSVASYVQSKYGSSGQYTIRGYSMTGVPLYKPK